jgi:hypothetical protein
MNFENFLNNTQKFVENSKLRPKLYHLHFTISNQDIDEIKISTNDNKEEIIKIHTILLLPNLVQKQTVYKNSNIEKILYMANRLYQLHDEKKIELIGTKLECLFSTKDLLENLSELPKFNYVELHYSTINEAMPDHLKQTQLVSYSIKHKALVSAIRFYDDMDHSANTRNKMVHDLNEWFKVFEPKALTEVSIFDYWSFDIEKEWRNLHDIKSLNEMINLFNNFKN